MGFFKAPNIEKLKAKGDINGLIKALGDRMHIRIKAADALEKMGWRPNIDEAGAAFYAVRHDFKKCKEIGAPAIKPLKVILHWDSRLDAYKAKSVIEILKDLTTNKDLANHLRKALQLEIYKLHWSIKEVIAESLGEIGDDSSSGVLIRELQTKDNHHKIVHACIKALGKIGSGKAVKTLIALVEDKEAYSGYRYTAIQALGETGGPRAERTLAEIAKDFKKQSEWERSHSHSPGGIPNIPRAAAYALKKIRERKA